MRYTFGGSATGDGKVLPEDRYGVQPYGFFTEECTVLEKRLEIPELNSGFEKIYWCRNQKLSHIEADENGCFQLWEGEGEIPLTFAADVEREGNYLVAVTVFAPEDVEEAMIFLGRRRLGYLGRIPGNTYVQKEFVVNLCPVIPRGQETVWEDRSLDVTIIGRSLHLSRIELHPWDGKTLYIAGDSTVTDQSAAYPYLPGSSYCGWGQMLSCYLGCQMAVSNHAHSGLTTESFRSEGHYDILRERIKEGDICLFQFGHNDQKLDSLKAEGGYRDNLLRYIQEIREKGANPVLVTPLARNSWRGDDGSYNDLLKPYADECIRLATEQKVPLLDLHRESMAFVRQQGCEMAKRYFYPSDYTHSNDYGAYRFAGYVYEKMKTCGLVEEKALREWEPPRVLQRLTVPREWEGIENPEYQPLFENLERPEDLLTRVEALEMVITAMHFFPTNVYNDMFQDVIGHETYAGIVECAVQNGLIPQEWMQGNMLFPKKWITGQEYINILLHGYQSRKPLPEMVEGEKRDWRRFFLEKFSSSRGDVSGEGYLTRQAAAEICRQFHI